VVETSTSKHEQESGYYGRSMIKPPEWTDLIPTYFFVGGMAGTCATAAFAERIAKNDPLARVMLLGAAAGSAVSGFCLIADLKRPERFVNMLRVFKPTSPMSVGVYIFSAFGGSVMLAAASELTGVLRPIGRIFEGIAALLGPAMSVYTAVLIGDTVVPAWHHGRLSMPMLFAATSLSSAGAVGMLFTPAADAGTARRMAMLGGVGVQLALERLHTELGPRQKEAYERGEAMMYSKAAKYLTIAGTAAAVFARKNDTIAKIAGGLLLAAGVAERFGVFRAGCNSAHDPSFTIDAQRSRIGDRPQPKTSTSVETGTVSHNGHTTGTSVSS
jgi:formate-dependent nitrite reductase membrane component NrfD